MKFTRPREHAREEKSQKAIHEPHHRPPSSAGRLGCAGRAYHVVRCPCGRCGGEPATSCDARWAMRRRACHVVRCPCGRCRQISQPLTPPPPSLKRRAAKEGTAQARFRRCAPAAGTAGQTSRVAPSLALGLLCAPCPLAAPSALAGVSIASAPLGLRPRPQRRRHRYRAGATVFVGWRAKMRRRATPLAGSSRWRAAGLRLRATRL